jgi:SAM-dependent methyltransferase
MAAVCPVTLDVSRLREEVRRTYAAVARSPASEFHFHRGPEYAVSRLGYDPTELQSLPTGATAAFAGVGNPFDMESIGLGATVIDNGSGAGMDCLLAGRRVGSTGSVIGFDMTDEMLARARAAAGASHPHVRFEKADVQELPLPGESVDVVISNGVFNLLPDKEKLFRELFRVVRPGGRLQFADIIVGVELSEKVRNDIDLWTG